MTKTPIEQGQRWRGTGSAHHIVARVDCVDGPHVYLTRFRNGKEYEKAKVPLEDCEREVELGVVTPEDRR